MASLPLGVRPRGSWAGPSWYPYTKQGGDTHTLRAASPGAELGLVFTGTDSLAAVFDLSFLTPEQGAVTYGRIATRVYEQGAAVNPFDLTASDWVVRQLSARTVVASRLDPRKTYVAELVVLELAIPEVTTDVIEGHRDLGGTQGRFVNFQHWEAPVSSFTVLSYAGGASPTVSPISVAVYGDQTLMCPTSRALLDSWLAQAMQEGVEAAAQGFDRVIYDNRIHRGLFVGGVQYPYTDRHTGVTVANQGEFLSQLPWKLNGLSSTRALAFAPDIVVLALGYEDQYLGYAVAQPAAFNALVTGLVNGILAQYPDTRVLLCAPHQRTTAAQIAVHDGISAAATILDAQGGGGDELNLRVQYVDLYQILVDGAETPPFDECLSVAEHATLAAGAAPLVTNLLDIGDPVAISDYSELWNAYAV